jgi:hypothetical protein
MHKMNSNSVVRALSIVLVLFLLAPVNAVYVFADSDGLSDPQAENTTEKMKNDDDLAKPLLVSKVKPLPDSKEEKDGAEKPASETQPPPKKYITKVKTKPFPIWTAVGIGVAAAGVIGLAIGSGGGGSSAAPTPPPEPPPEIVGPDLNGSDWSGSILFKDIGEDQITATITHVGNQVTIETSRPADSLGHLLTGTITSSGNMLMYDTSDGQDWTSLYGPETSNSLSLADYVFENGVNTGTNVLKLRR